jgi:hypothetical protein
LRQQDADAADLQPRQGAVFSPAKSHKRRNNAAEMKRSGAKEKPFGQENHLIHAALIVQAGDRSMTGASSLPN